MAIPGTSPMPSETMAAWTVAMDTLAGAGRVAGAATAEHALRADTAELTGEFADGALVDLLPGDLGLRSVAASRPDRHLVAPLSRMSVRHSPLAMAAIRRCTPIIKARAGRASAGRT